MVISREASHLLTLVQQQDSEEISHLLRLIELHEKNIRHYEELEAKYGPDCLVYVKNAKEEARKGLAEARANLAAFEGRAPGAEPSIPSPPQNFPRRSEFIGREREMEQVRQALASRSYLVEIIVNAGAGLEASQAGVALAETYPQVYVAVGIHLHGVKTLKEKMKEIGEAVARPTREVESQEGV